MIGQAKSYLQGATWATVLIGVALVAFVAMMAAIGTGHSPIAALGLGGNDPVVTVASQETDDQAESGDAGPESPALDSPAANTSQAEAENRRRAVDRPGRRGARNRPTSRGDGGNQVLPPAPGPASDLPSAPPPAQGGGGDRNRPAAGSDPGGRAADRPPSSGGSNGGAPGSGGNPAAPPPPASAAGGGSGGGDGGGVTPISDVVNNTVDQVDQALNGTLSKTGLDQVVKEVNNGLLGPDTTLGKTVNGVTGTLGRLLGPRR